MKRFASDVLQLLILLLLLLLAWHVSTLYDNTWLITPMLLTMAGPFIWLTITKPSGSTAYYKKLGVFFVWLFILGFVSLGYLIAFIAH